MGPRYPDLERASWSSYQKVSEISSCQPEPGWLYRATRRGARAQKKEAPMSPIQARTALSALSVAALATHASAQYCTPSSLDSTYEYIQHIQVAALSHTLSAPPPGGYFDATAFGTDLDRGANYEVSVTIGNNFSGDQCALWVDWDHSGTFEPSEKLVVGANFGPYTATLAVPPTAVPGPTRMRVRVTWQEAV